MIDLDSSTKSPCVCILPVSMPEETYQSRAVLFSKQESEDKMKTGAMVLLCILMPFGSQRQPLQPDPKKYHARTILAMCGRTLGNRQYADPTYGPQLGRRGVRLGWRTNLRSNSGHPCYFPRCFETDDFRVFVHPL
jgi:hypothetical protein